MRISEHDVINRQFLLARRKGYEKEDVDQFLDDVAETLREMSAEADSSAAEARALRLEISSLQAEYTKLEHKAAAMGPPGMSAAERESYETRARDLEKRIQELEEECGQLRKTASEAQEAAAAREQPAWDLSEALGAHKAAVEYLEEAGRKAQEAAAQADKCAADTLRDALTVLETICQKGEEAARDARARRARHLELLAELAAAADQDAYMHDVEKGADNLRKIATDLGVRVLEIEGRTHAELAPRLEETTLPEKKPAPARRRGSPRS